MLISKIALNQKYPAYTNFQQSPVAFGRVADAFKKSQPESKDPEAKKLIDLMLTRIEQRGADVIKKTEEQIKSQRELISRQESEKANVAVDNPCLNLLVMKRLEKTLVKEVLPNIDDEKKNSLYNHIFWEYFEKLPRNPDEKNVDLTKSLLKGLMQSQDMKISEFAKYEYMDKNPDFFKEENHDFAKKIIVDLLSSNDSNIYGTARRAGKKEIVEKDPDFIKLEKLASAYQKSGDRKDKIALLKQEEEILLQELENPEKHMLRAIISCEKFPVPEDLEQRKNRIIINTLTGMREVLTALKYLGSNIENPASVSGALDNLIENIPANNPKSEFIKLRAISCIAEIYDCLDENNKIKTNSLLVDIFSTSSSDDCKKFAYLILKKKMNENDPNYNKFQEICNSYEKNDFSEIVKDNIALTIMTREKSPILKKLIPQVLNSDEVQTEEKVQAAWCAGKVRTPENYNALLNIIKSPLPQDKNQQVQALELKEIALNSFSLYLKHKPQEVKGILREISGSDSSLAEIATIMHEKATGTFNTPDHFINFLPKNEQKKYKKLRDKYVQNIDRMGARAKNFIDLGIIPFYKVLEKLVNDHTKFTVINDTVTAFDRNRAGKRNDDGRFRDTVFGTSLPNNIIISDYIYKNGHFDQVSAHEFNHSACRKFDRDDRLRLIDLHEKAKEEGKCLDYYAEKNFDEYFAHGYEAYLSPYMPHSRILRRKSTNALHCHTRSVLKQKDPDLYEFIEYCIDKYGPGRERIKFSATNRPVSA